VEKEERVADFLEREKGKWSLNGAGGLEEINRELIEGA
jgi:hypothetical protein